MYTLFVRNVLILEMLKCKQKTNKHNPKADILKLKKMQAIICRDIYLKD